MDSFKKYSLSIYYVPDPMLDVNRSKSDKRAKTDRDPPLWTFCLLGVVEHICLKSTEIT